MQRATAIPSSGRVCPFRGDARLVGDALLREPRWDPDNFEPYARERAERMRRLRATAEAMTRLRADFTPDGHRRRDAAFARFAADPAARMPIAAGWVGPDALPRRRSHGRP